MSGHNAEEVKFSRRSHSDSWSRRPQGNVFVRKGFLPVNSARFSSEIRPRRVGCRAHAFRVRGAHRNQMRHKVADDSCVSPQQDRDNMLIFA